VASRKPHRRVPAALGAEPTSYGEGMVDRVRQLAPDGVDRAPDTAGRGALADLIEIIGSPDNVVTTADFSAPGHGVRVTTGADQRAWQPLGQAAELHEAGKLSVPVEQTFRSTRRPRRSASARPDTSAASSSSSSTEAQPPPPDRHALHCRNGRGGVAAQTRMASAAMCVARAGYSSLLRR
jgi:hypothetical protein